MGLPEIVDTVRNFAVMVRVQGPDPKSLKMRTHAFHHYNSGRTTLSASGMLLPTSFVDDEIGKQILGENNDRLMMGSLVITVASVIEPFLSVQHRENISKAKPVLVTGAQIDIMVEGKKGNEHGMNLSDKEGPHWLSAELLTLVEIPVASFAIQSLIEASTGASDHDWEVGWSLASYSNGPQPFMDTLQQQRNGQAIGEESNNPGVMGKSTTRVAVLGVSSKSVDLRNLSISPSNKKGDLLLAIGSPFGILSPVHFFNSISVGSIANCYPAASCNRSLLMADIRCLPGMEGSPVFTEHAQFIGVLTRPLRQRVSGAEIQMVIPWEAIATSCSNLLQKEPQKAQSWIQANNESSNAVGKTSQTNYLDLDRSFKHVTEKCSPPSHVENAMASICLITIDDGAWASGVLINKQGLILTNAHLLEPWRFRKAAAGEKAGAKSEVIFTPSGYTTKEDEKSDSHQRSWELLSRKQKSADSSVPGEYEGYKFSMAETGRRSIRVRLDSKDPWIWVDAKVVFVSQGPLDVALLQLDFVPEQLRPIVINFTCPVPGSRAYVIGHGLFGPRRDFFPSACVGVVAKVVKTSRSLVQQSHEAEKGPEQIPAMIETTAAVHPGGSGGAVVNSNGHMIGLVTSNARHGGGMIIPHLNFSIPSAALEPLFKFSKDMHNVSLLADLDKPNENLSSVWALVPPLSPKPGPSLPDLSKFLPGDNIKDMKGSRFAKFIAERQEFIKKTPQSGGVEGTSTHVIPSKL